jgi:hypothetical protein
MMPAFRNICALSMLILPAGASMAVAAAIPDDLIGKWSARAGGHCGFQFTPKGFTGSSDSDGYGCRAKSVLALAHPHGDPAWRVVFVCKGEFGQVQVNSLIRLQTINGERVMTRAETLRPQDAKKAALPALSILHKCR